jgi:UDP-glucose 4-epimerase
MKRALVTGGAGFIGSHLVDKLLAQELEVVVLDNESTGNRSNVHRDAVFVHGDVRDDVTVRRTFELGFDLVCHIAGQASISLSYDDPAKDLSVNVNGTLNVLQSCLAFKVPRLLYASSMTVYGNPTQVPTPESAPVAPVSYYGITKLAAEQYLHLCAQRTDLAAPLEVTSFRMFNVYGPRQSLSNPYQGVLAIFLGNLLRNEPITICSDGEQSRDFVYISDVVRAWTDAIYNPATYGRVLNIGSGSPTTVNQLCDAVLARHSHDRGSYRVNHAPAQQGDIRASAADISAIVEATGWQPEVPLEEGIEATVDWSRGVNSFDK